MTDVLKLLSSDCKLTSEQIAVMTGRSEDEVNNIIADCERKGVILGYQAVIDWEKTGEELVTALIDVKITPQRGEGFDRVAEHIYQFDEVESLYLMSGGYDLSVLLTGRTLKEVALFVAQKLSPLEAVSGTATHFLLKKYKDHGVVFETQEETQERIQFI